MIILSAALDLVGPTVPKGVVLLCDVIPSFLTKLLAPYFIQAIPYPLRVILLCIFSAIGMLLIALTPAYTDGGTISTKMAGVVLASLSSGAGELSFVSLVHYYGPFSLAAWGSGTGGAGLVGAGMYALATTTLGLSSRSTIFASAFLPIVMLVAFFVVLPRGPLSMKENKTERVRDGVDHTTNSRREVYHDEDDESIREDEGLLRDPTSNVGTAKSHTASKTPFLVTLKQNLRRSRSLFFPLYASRLSHGVPASTDDAHSMLPLLLVYIAEYTINQGVAPTLLFPLASSPFSQYVRFLFLADLCLIQFSNMLSSSSHITSFNPTATAFGTTQ